jgi:site-specific DNA-cytosine methylase
MQQDFLSPASLTNASHVSTFCSYVDVVRPEYGILENVVNMASTRKGFEEQNVMSQLVACLVSLGYQVNQFIMDAWTYGSAQHRSRVFLTIAAPGLTPIVQPKHTHSLSYEDTVGRSLGYLPNGQKFGEREHYPTPFAIVTAGEATSDLPNIGNGNVQICISHPDHRLSSSHNRNNRSLMEYIPRHPPGSGYAEAMLLGLVPPMLQKTSKREIGKCFQRVKENGLTPTITTGISPQNGRGGATLHWSEPRSMSIQEARRAQGYLDTEVIIGTLPKQWAIVGNGVDRKVSLALGFALHTAIAARHMSVSSIPTSSTPAEGLGQLLNRHKGFTATSSDRANGLLPENAETNDRYVSLRSEADISNSSNHNSLARTLHGSRKRPASQPDGKPAQLIDNSEDELIELASRRISHAPSVAREEQHYDFALGANEPSALPSSLTRRLKYSRSTVSTPYSQASPRGSQNISSSLDISSESSSTAQRNRHRRF